MDRYNPLERLLTVRPPEPVSIPKPHPKVLVLTKSEAELVQSYGSAWMSRLVQGSVLSDHKACKTDASARTLKKKVPKGSLVVLCRKKQRDHIYVPSFVLAVGITKDCMVTRDHGIHVSWIVLARTMHWDSSKALMNVDNPEVRKSVYSFFTKSHWMSPIPKFWTAQEKTPLQHGIISVATQAFVEEESSKQVFESLQRV